MHLLPNMARPLGTGYDPSGLETCDVQLCASRVCNTSMGFLRFILTALLGIFALVAGFFAMLLVALTGIFASLFGSPRRRQPRPHLQSRSRPQAQPRTRQSQRPIDGDVIDVDASEVRDRPSSQ